MPNFTYRSPDGFNKAIDTGSLAAEFSGAPPPNSPDPLNDELSALGLLSDRGWEISGLGQAGLSQPPQVDQADRGLVIDWVPAVQNQHVVMRRGAAPAGDFGLYALVSLETWEGTVNVNFMGIFVGRMTGATVDAAVFAGRGTALNPSYGGKEFTSSSQTAGNFQVQSSAASLWCRLRYIAAQNRMWAGFSTDGRSFVETRTDVLSGGGANSVGLALISNQVAGTPRLVGAVRSFRVVPGTVTPTTPLPSSVFE